MSGSSNLQTRLSRLIGGSPPRIGRKVNELGAVTLALALTGCSWAPDSLNPAEWYRGVERAVSSDNTDLAGANSPYPKVSDVPGRPSVASAEHRREVAKILAADRENAKYTDEIVRQAPEASSAGIASASMPRKPAEILRPADRPGVELRDGQLVVTGGFAPTAAPSGDVVPDAPPDPPVLRPTRSADQPPPRAPAPPDPPPPASTSLRAPAAALEPAPPPAALEPAPPPAALEPAPPPAPEQRITAAQRLEILLNRTYSNADAVSAPRANDYSSVAASTVAQMPEAPGLPPALLAVIQFADGSANLSSYDRRVIADAARLALEQGGRVRVVGHAADKTGVVDPFRREVRQLELSSQRAEAVAGELMRRSVAPSSLALEAVGATLPRYAERGVTGIAANRRVELYLAY